MHGERVQENVAGYVTAIMEISRAFTAIGAIGIGKLNYHGFAGADLHRLVKVECGMDGAGSSDEEQKQKKNRYDATHEFSPDTTVRYTDTNRYGLVRRLQLESLYFLSKFDKPKPFHTDNVG